MLRHLSKAPIEEAVVEFAVLPSKGISLKTIEPLRDRWAAEYGAMTELYSATADIIIDAKLGSVNQKPEFDHIGYRTEAPSKAELVTLTTTGVSFHKLKPYSNWSDVFEKTWDLWAAFRDEVKPEFVKRVAARFINRLDLPTPQVLQEYVRSPAPINNYTLSGYAKRVGIVEESTGLQANMIEAIDSAPSNRMIITIDNDVFSAAQVDPYDDKTLRATFEKIHELKNKLFEMALTEKALEPYI